MSVKERDPLTGHLTTGHEWDGITELNTRVPRAIWWSVGITHAWALFYWILMPSWPLVTTYSKGLLGYDQQEAVDTQLVEAQLARSSWAQALEDMPIEAIRADPVLTGVVNETAPALFGDNCAGCHGTTAAGGPGFPSLTDDAWLWGGDADAIMETLRVGINSTHPETRMAQMLAFGRDGILSRDDIRTVVAYVQSLRGAEAPADVLAAGATIFADNCASCHAEDGKGTIELGAPDLTDAFWIYGGDNASLFETIYGGRQGWMPTWENRLGLGERKMLTIYVQDLGRGTQQ
jgi:cytochrome c oxidase cbb3-type subunit III